MKDTLKYVGLDVHKEKIAVAVADEGREKPRYLGEIPHTTEGIRKLVKKLGIRNCFEFVMKLVQQDIHYTDYFLVWELNVMLLHHP